MPSTSSSPSSPPAPEGERRSGRDVERDARGDVEHPVDHPGVAGGHRPGGLEARVGHEDRGGGGAAGEGVPAHSRWVDRVAGDGEGGIRAAVEVVAGDAQRGVVDVLEVDRAEGRLLEVEARGGVGVDRGVGAR